MIFKSYMTVYVRGKKKVKVYHFTDKVDEHMHTLK